MAFRRSAGRSVRPARKIDFKQWTVAFGASQDVTATGTFIASGILAFLEPATILRIRGIASAAFLVTGLTADDEASVLLGVGVFSTDAVALGATALPGPGIDPDYPWLWVGEFNMYTINASTAEPLVIQSMVVDTKAMRKVKPNESLVMVGDYGNVNGTPGLRISTGNLRVLIGT